MGKFSRDKGGRAERELVNTLNDAGFTALRVPLSGAMKGYEYDVIATKNGREFSFEVKARGKGLETIYKLYHREAKDGVMAYEGDNNALFYASADLEKLLDLKDCCAISDATLPNKDRRTVKAILNKQKLTKGANFLVLKGDRLGFLYVRFFG